MEDLSPIKMNQLADCMRDCLIMEEEEDLSVGDGDDFNQAVKEKKNFQFCEDIIQQRWTGNN